MRGHILSSNRTAIPSDEPSERELKLNIRRIKAGGAFGLLS